MPAVPKYCEECKEEIAIKGERYCKGCKKAVLAHLREVGYLETKGHGMYKGQSRPNFMREDKYETKHGIDE